MSDDTDLSPCPEDNHPVEDDRVERLANLLAGIYDYQSLTDLERENPDRAREHREAAGEMAEWLDGLPRQERQAAFFRGYDRGRETQRKTTAAQVRRLEDAVAELRQDRDPEGLRARIRDLEYALEGWDQFVTGRVRAGAAQTWEQQAAEYLAQLTEVQRELAVLKGVQPSNATRRPPS